MGSQLIPILANWFVGSKENIQVESTSKTKSVLYATCYDDIFVLVRNNNELNIFYHKMNTMISNLQFTLDKSLLDTKLKLISNRLNTISLQKANRHQYNNVIHSCLYKNIEALFDRLYDPLLTCFVYLIVLCGGQTMY